ncbi:MAG: cell division protein ZapA [Marinospirillum sp.]|uniref:cell division protein ZapA n=1 Tax=Marinospirillum sp. TaxID=2183934 RepID=UPI0019E38828|nr:cell division protein ZapA [Marinospirillum sp.]MBE0505123.1 cell division protein ZapA [Marinospirillum sp.]
MSSDKNTTEITLLDRKYLIACPAGEQDGLLRSAQYLNRKMQEIRQTGKVLSLERMAIMAALNITHDMLSREAAGQGSETQVARVNSRMDKVLQELDAMIGSRKVP